MLNVLRKEVDLTTLNVLRTTRAMLMNFCIINTQRGQILIFGSKVFYLFQQIFSCGKVKGNTTKKPQGLELCSLLHYLMAFDCRLMSRRFSFWMYWGSWSSLFIRFRKFVILYIYIYIYIFLLLIS